MCLLIIYKQTVHYLYIKKVILVQSLALWYKQCVQNKFAETHLRGYTVVLIDIGIADQDSRTMQQKREFRFTNLE